MRCLIPLALGGFVLGGLVSPVPAFEIGRGEIGHPPTWAVDPDVPGPTQPPVGRSLFDVLFPVDAGEPSTSIPFPFATLVARIQAHVEPGGAPARVLIPEGRSLQRYAAAPEFYRYPRQVVAINGEPARMPGQAGIFLRHLLFLGYQEKANSVEVISYNEQAGRFEFQIVYDYGAGLKPKVIYADRALCTACHQNGGPIFSQSPWEETDAHYTLAHLIQAERPEYYDKPLWVGRNDATWALDYATDRANYLASYQLLWQRGCGDELPATELSARCRATIVEAIIKFRLNGSWFVDVTPAYRASVIDRIGSRWPSLWPGGIYVPTADIANRDPLVVKVVSGALDPLQPRPPRAHWSRPALEIFRGLVRRLSELLSASDIKRIDMALYENALRRQVPREKFRSTCTVSVQQSKHQRAKIFCEGGPAAGAFGLQGWLELSGGKLIRGKLNELSLNGVEQLLSIELGGNELVFDAANRLLKLSFVQSKLINPRRRNGDLLESLVVRWQTDTEMKGPAVLNVLPDFGALGPALDELVDETSAGAGSALGVEPFQRRSVVQAVNRQLGVAPLAWP